MALKRYQSAPFFWVNLFPCTRGRGNDFCEKKFWPGQLFWEFALDRFIFCFGSRGHFFFSKALHVSSGSRFLRFPPVPLFRGQSGRNANFGIRRALIKYQGRREMIKYHPPWSLSRLLARKEGLWVKTRGWLQAGVSTLGRVGVERVDCRRSIAEIGRCLR